MVQVNHGSPSSASEHEQSTDYLIQDQNADEDEPETETGQEHETEMPKEESENEHLVDDQETNQEDGNDDDQETNEEDGYDHQEAVEEEEPPVNSSSILQIDEEVNQENNTEVESVEEGGAEESRKRGRESSTVENEEQNDEEKEEDDGKELQEEDQQVEELQQPQEQHPPEVDAPFDAVLYSPTPPSPQSVDYARWVQYHSQLPLNLLGYGQSVTDRHHSPENISEHGLGEGNGGEDEEGEPRVNREKGKAIVEDETKEYYKEHRELYSMMIENCYDSDDPRDREILKAMLAYRLDNSIIPEIKQLHNFIKNESIFEISAEELSIKVLILQAKFDLIVEEKGLSPAFDELYYQEMFDLSKQIWG